MLSAFLNWLAGSFLDLFGLNSKSGRILFVGLDHSGKTTLLHLLKTGKFTATAPTHYGTSEVGVYFIRGHTQIVQYNICPIAVCANIFFHRSH